jgi:hypothetical protein
MSRQTKATKVCIKAHKFRITFIASSKQTTVEYIACLRGNIYVNNI